MFRTSKAATALALKSEISGKHGGVMDQSKRLPNLPISLIQRIADIIDIEERPIANRELLKLCSEAGIDSLSYEAHVSHELAETALNYLVKTKYGKQLLSAADPSTACSEILRPLQKRLPTQSWRSDTQIIYQQFSTPAPIAFLAVYLLNLNERDIVLEPSCGTGNLAVWAQAARAAVVTNEIDARRRDLSKLLDLAPTAHDAEFIDDLLPENITPNVILANPPFSSSGGRVERNQSKFGFRHAESALRRLAAGGRFAIILGESGAPQTASGSGFWQSLSPRIQVTAAIALPGKEYYRNGTTVGVTLILGCRLAKENDNEPVPVENSPIISASSVEDAFESALAANLRFKSS
jgi:type I restriction-modification system DNA methylase subunit